MEPIPVAVVGASGYSGEELIRLLLRHPSAAMVCLTSRQHAGRKLSEIYPAFRRPWASGEPGFEQPDIGAIVASGARVAFLALPHGAAAEFAGPLLERGLRVIDLSADFRLRDPLVYREFYDHDHPAPGLLDRAVYGMPELYRAEIRDADLIASPGCYPTSVILPLHPLLRAGLIDPASVVAVSMSGVSGAGRKAELPYLFCECDESVRAYGIPKHRHLSEIEQELSVAAGQPVTISFAPHLVPARRGIATTTHARVAPGVTAATIADALCRAYGKEPFVRLLKPGTFADTKNVTRTNYIDIGHAFDARTGRVILASAIDNLTKGAAGQAIQSFNLIHGFPEITALV